jgi:hypothetical protein
MWGFLSNRQPDIIFGGFHGGNSKGGIMALDISEFLAKSATIKIDIAQGNLLNDKSWQIAGIPLGNGKYFMYEDSNAKIALGENEITIDIPKFTHAHGQVQIFDNPKQLYLTKDGFQPGPEGIAAFSCKMKASIKGGNLNDFRDGFCAFNVLDFSTGMVFDIVSNGTQVWVIYERLLIPGLIEENQAFTKVINIDYPTSPRDFLDCLIVYNQKNNHAGFYIGGRLIYEANNIPVRIENLFVGFGLITLHPIIDGKSVSCKGQGGTGTWGDFLVRRM